MSSLIIYFCTKSWIILLGRGSTIGSGYKFGGTGGSGAGSGTMLFIYF